MAGWIVSHFTIQSPDGQGPKPVAQSAHRSFLTPKKVQPGPNWNGADDFPKW